MMRTGSQHSDLRRRFGAALPHCLVSTVGNASHTPHPHTGALVKMLIMTDVTRYLDFKCCDGSYVWKSGGKVYKVPVTTAEALSSSLMGMFEKRRFQKFVKWVSQFDEKDEATWQGLPPTATMADCYAKFGLDANTQAVTGHALALYTADDYIKEPCLKTIKCVARVRDAFAASGQRPECPCNGPQPKLHPPTPRSSARSLLSVLAGASSCTRTPWPSTAPPPTCTRCTASASCRRALPASRPSTAAPTCWTSPWTRLCTARTERPAGCGAATRWPSARWSSARRTTSPTRSRLSARWCAPSASPTTPSPTPTTPPPPRSSFQVHR